MTTGRIELHNQCHGADDGKFCETPGPGASGGDWPDQRGREFKVVAKEKTVDGIASKKVYEVEASDGTKIRAYLIEGKENESAVRETLNSLAVQHEMYPSSPPRRAIIVDDNIATALEGRAGPRIGAWTYPTKGYRHSVFVNGDNLYSDRYKNAVASDKTWFMAQAQKTSPQNYLMTHESGHQFDFMSNRNSAKSLFDNPSIKKHLSEYGRTIKEEAYAEAFTEWHTSKGKTPNPAARAYAQHEGWFGTDGYKKPSLQASAMIKLTEFQPDETSGLEKLTPKGGAMIGDTFIAGEKPIVKGDLPDEPVSEKEQKDADKLVEEVYRSMGFDAEGNKLEYSATGKVELKNNVWEKARQLGIIQ